MLTTREGMCLSGFEIERTRSTGRHSTCNMAALAGTGQLSVGADVMGDYAVDGREEAIS